MAPVCNAALTSPCCCWPGCCWTGGRGCLAAHLRRPQNQWPQQERPRLHSHHHVLTQCQHGLWENRKQSQISGKHKETVGLGLTLVSEPCGRGDICPSGGFLPTGCRQAVMSHIRRKYFSMSCFHANYLNVFGKENIEYPKMREC